MVKALKKIRKKPTLIILSVFCLGSIACIQIEAEKLGVNLFLARRYSPSEYPGVVKAVKELKVHWVREEVSLRDIAPQPSQWNPDRYISAFKFLRKNGFYPLIVFTDVPEWLQGSLELESEFLLRAMREFYSYTHYFQILNEVNTTRFWGRAPDPSSYASLLRMLYPAVKDKMPDARIVMAGLATSDVLYFRAFAQAGGLQAVDIVAVHPYTFPLPFYGLEEDALTDIQTMVPEKELWVTEIGWSTASHSDGVSESDQANFLQESVARLLHDHVSKIFWYDFRDDGENPASVESHFGLIQWNYRPKLAFFAFQGIVQSSPMKKSIRITESLQTVFTLASSTSPWVIPYRSEDFLSSETGLYFPVEESIQNLVPGIDFNCLQARVSAHQDGLLMGVQLKDAKGKVLQLALGRIMWEGKKDVVAPIFPVDENGKKLLLQPPVVFSGFWVQPSRLFGGKGHREGVITVTNVSLCRYATSLLMDSSKNYP